MTSLSNKKIEKIAEKYKSENTKEYILKGFNIYWLATDTCNVKVKADTLTTPEPQDIPRPDEVPRQEETRREKRSSYFHTMYTANKNSASTHSITKAFKIESEDVKKRKRRGAPSAEDRLTKEEKQQKGEYDTQNAKIAYAMNIPTETSEKVKIMVMDHVEGKYFISLCSRPVSMICKI